MKTTSKEYEEFFKSMGIHIIHLESSAHSWTRNIVYRFTAKYKDSIFYGENEVIEEEYELLINYLSRVSE